jgi:transcriptional regulator with XRE-family HTH domain
MTPIDQFYSELGQRIRDVRQRKGWTQNRLADAVGYADGAAVSYWENGLHYPSLWVLRRIEEVTGEAVVQ